MRSRGKAMPPNKVGVRIRDSPQTQNGTPKAQDKKNKRLGLKTRWKVTPNP